MKNIIKVFCENTASYADAEMGTSLLTLCRQLAIDSPRPFLAAYVNNRIKELNYKIYTPVNIRFIDITHFEGYRVYQRTLSFIIQAAVQQIWPEARFRVRHSLGGGLYCEIEGRKGLTQSECDGIAAAARGIADTDTPVVRTTMPTDEVAAILDGMGLDDKSALLRTRPHLYADLYRIGDAAGCFFGALAPSAGLIDLFDVRPYYNGFYLAMPDRNDPGRTARTPQGEKVFGIFREYQSWVDIMGVPTVGRLNAKVLQGQGGDLIRIAEAFHERQLARIADTIAEAHAARGVRTVLISGPSSSGKTTTAQRLGIQLRVLGLRPVMISLDDYFVDRVKTPLDENGDYDYEALEAIDLAMLNDHLRRLMAGESVNIPRYDFITGTHDFHPDPLTLDSGSILIIEGIHGLNPRLTTAIADSEKFRIYVSCFTSVALDNVNRIATTDNRLLRRLTRDYATRGSNALATLSRWASVRRGEEHHIFPYQENADAMFNSSLFYEISVLRPLVEPILREVPDTVPEYGEAHRLLQFLDNFTPIPSRQIPPTSILREFIGEAR